MKKTLSMCMVLASALGLSACGVATDMVNNPTAPVAKPPPMPETFKNKCDAAKGQLRPLVVEWEAPDRAALEAQAQQGQLVVHYEGCELEVLRRCKAPPKQVYGYTAITPKDERVTMSNAEELYASIPVHAAKLEGKLAESGSLAAEMTIVGEYGVAGLPPAVDQLSGECGGATHVVTALTVGAFSFNAGNAKERGASATVLGAGVGASQAASSETLSRDGDVAKCAVSKRGDVNPPDGCGALLRLELAALLPAGEGIPDCKVGTRLVGKECKAVEKPEKLSSDDEKFVDDKAGFGWGTRCYLHFKAGALPFARAACKKGLEIATESEVKGSLFYNYALVEEATGDPVAACELLSQSVTVRPNKVVQKKIETMGCKDLMRAQ